MIDLDKLQVDTLLKMYTRWHDLSLQNKAISCRGLTGECLRGIEPLPPRGSSSLKLHVNIAMKVAMEPDYVDGGEIKLAMKNRAMRGPSSFLVMVWEFLESTIDVTTCSSKMILLQIRRDICRSLLLEINKDIMETKGPTKVSHSEFPALGVTPAAVPRTTVPRTAEKPYAETARDGAQSARDCPIKKPGGGGDDGRRLPVMPEGWTVSDPCFLTLLKAYGIEMLERDLMDTAMSVLFLVLAMSDDGSVSMTHLRPQRTHRAMVECVGYVAEKGLFGPKFNSMSKTRIRGVVGMLKASEVVITTSAGDDTSPCLLALNSKVQNMLQVRLMVDTFLVRFVKEHRGQALSSPEKEKLTWLLLPKACSVLAEGIVARVKPVVKTFLSTYNEPAIHTTQPGIQPPHVGTKVGVTVPPFTPSPSARPPGSYGEIVPALHDDVMPSPQMLFVNTALGKERGSQEPSPMTTDEGATSPHDMLTLFAHHEPLPSPLPADPEYPSPPGVEGLSYSLWGESTQTPQVKGQQQQEGTAVFGAELIQALSRDTRGLPADPLDPYLAKNNPPGL